MTERTSQLRATIATKLAQAIGPSAGAMTDATEIAQAVESEMNAKIYELKDYNAKARSLVFNLRNNAELRGRVISRSFSAEELVASSVYDLAPTQLQLQRRQSADRFFATRQLAESSEKVVGWQAGTSGKLEYSHKYESVAGSDGQVVSVPVRGNTGQKPMEEAATDEDAATETEQPGSADEGLGTSSPAYDVGSSPREAAEQDACSEAHDAYENVAAAAEIAGGNDHKTCTPGDLSPPASTKREGESTKRPREASDVREGVHAAHAAPAACAKMARPTAASASGAAQRWSSPALPMLINDASPLVLKGTLSETVRSVADAGLKVDSGALTAHVAKALARVQALARSVEHR